MNPLLSADDIWQSYLTNVSQRNNSDYVIPIKPHSPYKLETLTTDTYNMPYYTLNPSSTRKLCFVYLHGGAYLERASPYHWQFIDTIALHTQVKVFLPLYPLAPDHTYLDAYPVLIAFYKMLLATYSPNNIVFCGDSAGGGLSLGLAQVLPHHGLPRPSKLILLSPWLDGTMSNPAIPGYADLDSMISSKLYMAGLAWVGEPHQSVDTIIPSTSKLHDPLVSPMYGDLKDLPPILLFTGTSEVLHPDALKFHKMLEAASAPVELVIGKNMPHVWPAIPVPGAEADVCRICKWFDPEFVAPSPITELIRYYALYKPGSDTPIPPKEVSSEP